MSEWADERREERRAQMAAEIDEANGVQPDLGYDPDQYELVDDDDQGTEAWDDAEPVAAPDATEVAQANLAQFEEHLQQLERDTGITVPHAARRDIVLTSIERGGLTHDNTEALFYRHAQAALEARENAETAAERALEERRLSKDPNVRRNARRERMVRAIDQGGGWA